MGRIQAPRKHDRGRSQRKTISDPAGSKLRTARDLARLHLGRGRCDEARAVLGTVYASSTGGFGTRDLKEGTGLLEEAGS